MAYIGKYIDRNPCIKTAGISLIPIENVGDSLKVYPNEEAAEAIIKAKCLKETPTPKHIVPRSPYIPNENIKDIFSTELKKSRFVAFREKFSEDMFFKKPELGKVFPLNVKPDYVTNDNTTFGDTSKVSEPIYGLVLPKKSPNEVNRQYAQFHDKYVLSHKHYFPSERINRHYDRKYFNPSQAFGVCRNIDYTGGNVRKCLTQCERLIIISKAQKVFLEMSMGKLGKRSKRHEGNIPPDAVLGLQIPRDVCDAKALIENIDPCIKKTKLIESMAHINKLRRKLFSRVNFHIHDLKSALEYLDEEHTGFLPLSKIFEAAHSLRIHMEPEKIRTAASLFELFVDEGLKTERVNYKGFLQILQIQYPLPKTGNISTMPDNVYNKETTYRELCKDINKKPIGAYDPILMKVTKEEKTTAKDLVSPDIPLRYGLGQRDFDARRSKDDLQRIFKRVITDPNKFEEIWQKAVEKLKPDHNLISVDEFRFVMNNPN